MVRYGQMTAGSYCYIGPQGIVHGTVVGQRVDTAQVDCFQLLSNILVLHCTQQSTRCTCIAFPPGADSVVDPVFHRIADGAECRPPVPGLGGPGGPCPGHLRARWHERGPGQGCGHRRLHRGHRRGQSLAHRFSIWMTMEWWSQWIRVHRPPRSSGSSWGTTQKAKRRVFHPKCFQEFSWV